MNPRITKKDVERFPSNTREILYFFTIHLGLFKLDSNKDYVLTKKGRKVFEESNKMHNF